jgi:NitT/TauT family transport system permease protein
MKHLENRRFIVWSTGIRRGIAKIVPVAAILLVWESWVRIFHVPAYFLPPVSTILVKLGQLVLGGELIVHTLYTIYRSLLGIFIGATMGVIIGFMMAWYRYAEEGLDFIIAATYPLPKVALIPLLMVWLGLGEAPILAMSVMGVVYPVIINTVAGAKNIDPLLIRAARDLGATDRQLFREVMLPGSLPMIFAGLKLGAGIAFILVVAAEMVIGKYGLGNVIAEAAAILHLDVVFATLLELCVIGILLFMLVDFVERITVPWHSKVRKAG